MQTTFADALTSFPRPGHLWRMFCPPQVRLRQRTGDGFAAFQVSRASIPAVPCPLTSPPRRPRPPPGRQNMISSNRHSFPLSGVVAFAGSRYGSPFPVAPVVSTVLSSGGFVRVGCVAGVDAAVRSCCPSPWWCVPSRYPVRLMHASQPAPARWSPALPRCASPRPLAALSAPAPH